MSEQRTIEKVLYCTDLDKEPGFPGCCDSCHEDANIGYDDLAEFYVGERMTHKVCCRVSGWLQSRGVRMFE